MPAGKMKCPKCGAMMNHHADKVMYSTPGDPGYSTVFDGSVEETHACPNCGASASRISAN